MIPCADRFSPERLIGGPRWTRTRARPWITRGGQDGGRNARSDAARCDDGCGGHRDANTEGGAAHERRHPARAATVVRCSSPGGESGSTTNAEAAPSSRQGAPTPSRREMARTRSRRRHRRRRRCPASLSARRLASLAEPDAAETERADRAGDLESAGPYHRPHPATPRDRARFEASWRATSQRTLPWRWRRHGARNPDSVRRVVALFDRASIRAPP